MSKEHASSGSPAAIPLTNAGELTITFIGAGSAFSKKRFQNNILIVKGEDHLLVDCGTRTPEALAQLGQSVATVRNYLITHTHADHIGGLEEVMLVNRYFTRKKPTIIVTERLKRILWNYSLRGGNAYNEFKDGKPLDFDDYFDTIYPVKVEGGERELCEAHLGKLEVRLFRTKHFPDSARDWRSSFPSYGLVIDRRVLFTSDTRYDPNFIKSLDREYDFETIYHDCQLFTGGVHASLEELAGLPESIRAKIRLMHYGDNVENFMDRIKELGFVGLAEQWQPYTLPSGKKRPSR